MEEPIEVEVNSITTTNSQKLYLNNQDAKKIKGKRVALVDDVISTSIGSSIYAFTLFLEQHIHLDLKHEKFHKLMVFPLPQQLR